MAFHSHSLATTSNTTLLHYRVGGNPSDSRARQPRNLNISLFTETNKLEKNAIKKIAKLQSRAFRGRHRV